MNHPRPVPRRATRDNGGRFRFPCLVVIACLAAALTTPLSAILAPITKSFYLDKTLPCPASVHVALDGVPITYACTSGTIQLRDMSIRWSGDARQTMVAPLLDSMTWHQWTGSIDAEVSQDLGATWQRCAGTCELIQGVLHSFDADGIEQYDTITRLTGTIPVGPLVLNLRTRDDQPNSGQTTMQAVPGGFMIDSFFDIFTEVSVDGGATWAPGDVASLMAMKVDHRPDVPVLAPSVLLPCMCDQYSMKPGSTVTVPGGVVIRNVRHKLLTNAVIPPSPGASNILLCNSQLDCEISTDGGGTWLAVRAPATTRFRFTRLTLGSQLAYDAEVTQLTVTGGELPAGVRFRESITQQSVGLTSIEYDAGGYRVSSFFDIFLEVSTNGGSTWQAASNGPAVMQATSPAPQVACATTDLLPATGRHVAVPGATTTFANGIVIRNMVQDTFVGSVVPPVPGAGPVTGAFTANTTLQVSLDAGGTFTPVGGLANCGLTVTNLKNLGGTCYYTTEMLGMELQISGGAGLPVMIRESPTRVSYGRASTRPDGGGYAIDSFFDIYLEVSLDGGQTWSPSVSGPATLALQPAIPPVLTITAPVDMTLAADRPDGRVVDFAAVTTGGCAPLGVTCMPPSGSLFPPGVTSVLCTVTDACGQTASASFQITITPYEAPEWFYASKKMPPPEGMEMAAGGGIHLFPNGVAIRNLRHRQFSGCVMPPVLGASVSHTFGSQVEMDVSLDGGATWDTVSSPATCDMTLDHVADVGSVESYSLEVTNWTVGGAPLPGGVMIRESPTRASGGSTSVRGSGGGFMISSFFDIYLEVSTDGGITWVESLYPDAIWVYPDPALHTPAPVLASRLPAPDDQWASTADPALQTASGFTVHAISIRAIDNSAAPPSANSSTTVAFNAVADLNWSLGVGPAGSGRALVNCTMDIKRLDSAADVICEAEITSLNLTGGDLPVGVMIRESPTEPSRGMCSVSGGGGGGGSVVQSFFDIFLEVSIDGGVSWSPPIGEPTHLESRPIAVAHPFSQASLTPPSGEYVGGSGARASFPSGIIIRGVRTRSFDSVLPPPPPGATLMQSCNGWMDMEISIDGGGIFQSYYGAVFATVNTTSRLTAGTTSYFDTEMLQLDVIGGSLPVGVMIRESPTRASGGRACIRANGPDNDCDSFFDIFLEVSTDGGNTWNQANNGPLTLLLQTENCPALVLNTPSNITVRATSAAGAVVTYPQPTTEGGSPPTMVSTKWPSGSTFPVGTTTVNLYASDMCGQTAEGSFQVTVLRPLEKHFYAADVMPPPNSMWSLPQGAQITYANGIVVRNLALRQFSASVAPPATTGADISHSFASQAGMEISWDGGLTWVSCVANASLRFNAVNNGADGVDTLYGLELVQIDISGGTLPVGIQIRESPTRASHGETRTEIVPGGYMIDSFFDIYLEVSTDGGVTWWQAASAAEIAVKMDPASAPAVTAPRNVFPMPNGQYVISPSGQQAYACGIVIRELKMKDFTGWLEPPLLGNSQVNAFDLQLDFELSIDGGAHWNVARAPATMSVDVVHTRSFGTDDDCDSVVTQLDIAGGDLPVGVLIRESPTRASGGGTSMSAGGGGYMISSFFDIFTEVSTDGGITWGAATNGPAHMQLERVAPAYVYPDNMMPPPHGRYAGLPATRTTFANGMILKNVLLRQFTASIPPPLPGWSTSHTFGSQVEMDVSTDNGLTFNSVSVPGTLGMQITARLGDDGVTEYYDTEMVTFNISGGGLPANVLIRESPTRASSGRTTQSVLLGGGAAIDSFFDIYIEVSTDGGASWLPAQSGAMAIQLSEPPPALEVIAPPDQWALATSPGGALVSYPAPTTIGGVPPVTVTCNPPSGAVFPVGVTTVNCMATDAVGQSASDTFIVTVLPAGTLPAQFFASDSFPPFSCMYLSTQQWFTLHANGVVIRNVVAHGCMPTWPPPAPGTSSEVAWNADVTLEMSFDNGITFASYKTPAACVTRITGPPLGSGILDYDTEMLEMNLSGGTLPGGVIVRESPTLPSLGRVNRRSYASGWMISSFFDVFTEVSTDGGMTWSPSQASSLLESRIDDTWVTPVATPSLLMLPPNDRLTQGAGVFASFPGNIVFTGLRISRPSASVPPPFFGAPVIHPFSAQLDLQYSLDNGATFNHARASLSATLRMNRISAGQPQRLDCEFLSLQASGGGLPVPMMIRESPTEPSSGQATIDMMPDGTYQISSFFDIFLEVSTDGGLTWMPSTLGGPGRLQLTLGDAEEEYAAAVLPPLTGMYACAAGGQAVYANGIVIREPVRRFYTQATLPPPPGGGPVINTHGCTVDLWVSIDGGASFMPCKAPATATELTGCLMDSGLTRHFDTEMLQLDIAGGDLPGGLMLRESPSKPSLGRTSERNDPIHPTYHIESFFDVFTEVSTDGGMTWWPAVNGPLTMTLRTPTASEAWRLQNFGTTLNGGNAADMADPDADGQPNILEFATHTDPRHSNPPPASANLTGGHLVFTYPRAKEAMGEVTMAVEWSTTLEQGSWQTGATEIILSDDGVIQIIEATIPDVPGGRCFVRLRVQR